MGSCFSSSSSSRRKMDLDMLVGNHYRYPSALYNYDQLFPTSDENYARNLHLQEAQFSSLIASTAEIDHNPQLQRSIATCVKQEEPEIKIENEPAETSTRLCMICMDEKPSSDIFRGITSCTDHSYCTECIVRYVATKVEENVAMIKCPDVDCTRLIEPYACRYLIPKDVFERWDKALCESLILSSEKVYCPFEDCSAMLVVDEGNDARVTQTECPSCHRLFCAQCKVTWHAGIGCEEFRRVSGNTTKKKSSDEEDAMLIQMAKIKQWRRCPSCKFYVEKANGCLHITCRCGFQFCYGCGAAWGYRHLCYLSTKIDVDVLVDETYFSALFDYDEVFPISDVNYATELHLQEALFSSLVAPSVETNHRHPHLQMNITASIKQEPEIKIENEPSEPSRKLCMICMDEKPSSDIFRGTTTCTHSYCTGCTIRYVATKIKENAARIKCPDVDCTRLIEPYACRDLIPKDVFERWEKILCESLISSWDKFYCPFKDCSAMMVEDGSNAKVTQTECPSCHRLFCVQCKVTWHAGIGCEEFQRFGNTTKKKSSDEEDAMLIQMAKNKHWRRCPSCKFYVDKVDGCLHINCRCGFQFCYGCGSTWDSHHVCRT